MEKNKKRNRVSAAIPDKLRKKLYPVVFDLFSKSDFHQVNIREICKRTSISPSTIYKYFQSKEDLIFRILDEKISELIKLIKEHVQGIESAKEILRKVFWVTMDFYDKNPGVAITVFITVPTRAWMKEKSYQRKEAQEIVKGVFENKNIKDQFDPSVDIEHVVGLYYMYCYRHIHLWYYHGMKWRLIDAIPRFFPICWRAVGRSDLL
jgi:AcrR family transcriptional regulator